MVFASRMILSHCDFFFFFQAEDGIRDRNVTGVQTCALPISPARSGPAAPRCTSAGGRESPPRPACRRARSGGTYGRARARSICPATSCRRREIGRASCRERVEVGGGGGAVERKEKYTESELE